MGRQEGEKRPEETTENLRGKDMKENKEEGKEGTRKDMRGGKRNEEERKEGTWKDMRGGKKRLKTRRGEEGIKEEGREYQWHHPAISKAEWPAMLPRQQGE